MLEKLLLLQVGQGQVRPLAAEVQAILDFPLATGAPKTHWELHSFLGVAGYYRAFNKNVSDIVAPLTSLVSPKVPFQWSEEYQSTFKAGKALLCRTSVLASPNFIHLNIHLSLR